MSRQQYPSVAAAPTYPVVHRDRSWDDQYLERGRGRSREFSSPTTRSNRPRSADSRPQYNRATCLNMFYPTEHETRARLSYGQPPVYYPSQIPRVNGMYHSGYDREVSVSPGRSPHRAMTTHRDPYQRTMPTPDTYLSKPYHPSPPRGQYGYDPARQLPIIYGELEQSSASTGLSQEKLIQNRRRDEAAQQRKEKRAMNKPKKALVVNLPPSLFPTHSSRQQKYEQEHKPKVDRPRKQQFVPTSAPPPNNLSTRQNQSFQTSSSVSTSRNVRREPLSSVTSSDKSGAELPYEKPVQQRGWRSSMVRRMKSSKSSTGRRWKIIPSLSKSRSRSQSPSRKEKFIYSDEAGPNSSNSGSAVDVTSEDMVSTGSSSDLIEPEPTHTPNQRSHAGIIEEPEGEFNVDVSNITEDPFIRNPVIEDEGDARATFDFGAYYGADAGLSFQSDLQYSGSNKYGEFSAEHEGFSEDIPVGSPEKSPRSYAHFSPGDQYGMSSYDDSLSNYQTANNYSSQVSPSPPNGRRGPSTQPAPSSTRKPTKLVMEPKDYSKAGPYSRTTSSTSPSSRTASLSQSMSSNSYSSTHSQSSTSRELDYRSTKAYTQYDESYGSDTKPASDVKDAATHTAADVKNFSSYFSSATAAHGLAKVPPAASATKTSPTSVSGFPSGNVRWSDNLDQEPTRPRAAMQKPKSILRRRQIQPEGYVSDCPSDETNTKAEKAVRISDKPVEKGEFISDSPSALGFVDSGGRALSPIMSGDLEEQEQRPADDGTKATKPGDRNVNFEKNIPDEFQRAFFAENAGVRKDDDSGMISDAYTEFIESVASVVVQTAARQFLARTRVRKLAAESLNASRSYPMHTVSERTKSQSSTIAPPHDMSTLLYEIAATRIQAAFRGWWTRDCIAVDSYCASIIQKKFRSHLYRNNYLFQLCCIVTIQAAFRSYLVRKSVAPYTLDRDAATIMIQSRWRSFVCETKFLRDYEDVLIVQSAVRRWLATRRTRSLLKSERAHRGLGQGRLQKEKSWETYSLPPNYMNHTAFMLQKLPAPTGSPVRQTPRLSPDRNANDGAVSEDANMEINSFVSRAARSEIERRRKEKEQAKIAIIENEVRREQEAAAQAAEIREMRERMEMKGAGRIKRQPEEKKEEEIAPQVATTVMPQKMEPSESARFDEVERRKKMEESLHVVKESHLGDLRSQDVTTVVSSREGNDAKPRLKASSSTFQVLAGWRNLESNNSLGGPQRPVPGKDRPKPQRTNSFSRIMQTQLSPEISDSSSVHSVPAHTGSSATPAIPSRVIAIENSASDTADAARKKRIMLSLGIGSTVVDYDDSSDSSDDEELGGTPCVSAMTEEEGNADSSEKQYFSQPNPDDMWESQNASSLHIGQEAKRSMEEQWRMDKMHTVFRRVGLMASSRELSIQRKASEEPPWAKGSASSGALLTSTRVQQKNIDSRELYEKQSSLPAQDSFPSSRPHIRERASVVTQSQGIKPLVISPPVSVSQNSLSSAYIPAGSSHAGAQNASPEPETMHMSNGVGAVDHIGSAVHNALRAKRSEAEQGRINHMHLIFTRVGLMGGNRRPAKQELQGGEVYAGNKVTEVATVEEPSASDLLKSWRSRDQTQPKMNGKLF